MNTTIRAWFNGGSLLKGITAQALLIVHTEREPLRSFLNIKVKCVFVSDTAIAEEVKNNQMLFSLYHV